MTFMIDIMRVVVAYEVMRFVLLIASVLMSVWVHKGGVC